MKTEDKNFNCDIKEDLLDIRKLREDDINKGFFELLGELTKSPKPNEEDFKRRIKEIDETKCQTVIVAEYIPEHKIIGTLSFFIEKKFIHGLSQICHIEDVVVNKNYRNLHLGSKLVSIAKDYAKKEKCYKIILDCNENVKNFYEVNGFEKKAIGMQLYFE